ncbi:hypothetical protein CEXT_346841 [Caerostris extrusa]|uniref:Uncharacterized protein n=1 Tax=Caerostris extrusa TaxID=172846 RepID=A0AAV4Y2Y1_CAEEX|nr:hypothetical protein CEXT_346841 [Caerostris extrusa]
MPKHSKNNKVENSAMEINPPASPSPSISKVSIPETGPPSGMPIPPSLFWKATYLRLRRITASRNSTMYLARVNKIARHDRKLLACQSQQFPQKFLLLFPIPWPFSLPFIYYFRRTELKRKMIPWPGPSLFQ